MSTPAHPARSRSHRRPRALAEALERRMLLRGFPIGPESQVNTFTPSWQMHPAVASKASRGFVIAWTSYGQDGDAGVFAQHYDSAGMPQGGEFRANTFTPGWQFMSSVAMADTGNFVITWDSSHQDGGTSGIYAQRYNAAGAELGGEFRVNTFTPGSQFTPAVASDADGDFVVAWVSSGQEGSSAGIYAQRYDETGAPQGSEFRVNGVITGSRAAPSVAMDPDGDFVVTWQSAPVFSGPTDVYARRYTADGVPLGDEFRVNTFTTGNQEDSKVATSSKGDFVVAWSSYGQDGNAGVYAQRYDSLGLPQGEEFQVSTFTTPADIEPSVGVDSVGNFVVSWKRLGGGFYGYGNIYGQRFHASGARLAGEFRLNTRLAGPFGSALAMDADGDFIVAFTNNASPQPETLVYDIYAQRFRPVDPTQVGTVGDRVWSDLDGDGIQQPGEPSLGGVKVELLNDFGSFVEQTMTDTSGAFGFSVPVDVPARLRFSTPPGLIATRQNQGADDGSDSDANRITGLTPVFMLSSVGQIDDTIDAGYLAPASITGLIYSDRNGNGQRDNAEPGVPGFVVFGDLDDDGIRDEDEPFGVSTGDGSFAIPDLLPDMYAVSLAAQDLWSGPPPVDLNVPPSTTISGIDRPVRTMVGDSVTIAVGGEFRANDFTAGRQDEPVVASAASGDFLVIWTDGEDEPSSVIHGRRFNRSGMALGSDISFAPGFRPAIAMEPDGKFVLAWNTIDGSSGGVFARRYNADGTPRGPQFLVNTYTTDLQNNPGVALRAGGEFVVTFNANDNREFATVIYARLYDSSGVPQGGEFRVGAGFDSTVAMDNDGDFIVAWNRVENYYSDVFARRYNAAGIPLGDEFRVNDFTTGTQASPSLAFDGAGNFLIAWHNIYYGIIAQRYNAIGKRQGGPFRVNTTTGPIMRDPSVAVEPDGDFVIAWESQVDGSFYGVYGQRYNGAAVPQGGEFRVNTYTTHFQRHPSVAVDADGDFVIAWDSFQDGSTYGVYAQRYAVVPEVSSSAFLFESSPHRLRFRFNHDVRNSLSVEDLLVQNLTTGQTIPSNQFALLYDATSDVGTFIYLGSGSDAIGGVLPEGHYRATLLASGISTEAGASLASDYPFEFFFLNGDANRDGRVTLPDFNILAGNFGESGTDFSRGDFTYDGQTDLEDFDLLAGRFGIALPPVTSSAIGAVDILSTRRQTDDEDSLAALATGPVSSSNDSVLARSL